MLLKQLAVLSTCHFANMLFQQNVVSIVSLLLHQFFLSSTCCFSLQFNQIEFQTTCSFSTCHFIKKLFHQFTNLSTCHFIKLLFLQFALLSILLFINSPFCQLRKIYVFSGDIEAKLDEGVGIELSFANGLS
jgi:hypothetical protein